MDKNTYMGLANAIGSCDWNRSDCLEWNQYRVRQFPSTAFDSDYRCYCVEWEDSEIFLGSSNHQTTCRMVAKITTRNEIAVLDLLSKNRFPVPQILYALPGTNGKWIMFQQWVPGQELYACRTENAWVNTARILADIHLKFFEGNQVPDGGPWAVTGGDGILRRIQNARNSVRNCRPWNAIMDEFMTRMETAPKTLIHGDMFPTNVLTNGRGGIAFVDWVDSAVLPYMLDVGRMIGTVDKKTLQLFCPCEDAVLDAYYKKLGSKLGVSYSQFRRDVLLAKFLELASCYSPIPRAFVDKEFNKVVGEQLSQTALQLA